MAGVAGEYGVDVQTGGGFDSVTAKHDLAQELVGWSEQGADVEILHIGDHDPSGVHVFANLQEDISAFLAALGAAPADFTRLDDHLDVGMRPSVILMNPPFSAMANVDGRTTEATARHLRSALARLAPGGRLVAITGASFAPDAPAWAETFDRLTESAHLVFTGAVSGAAFAKHGTTFETRISVFDKCRGCEVGGVTADLRQPTSPVVAHLLARITAEVPPRLELDQAATASQSRFPLFSGNSAPSTRKAIGISRATSAAQPAQAIALIEAEDLAYVLREVRDNDDTARLANRGQGALGRRTKT